MDELTLNELNNMPDRLILKENYRPIALYLEAKPYFQQYESIKIWEQDVNGLANGTIFRPSESFSALSECVFQMLLQGKIPTKQMLKEAFVDYIDTILYEVEPLLKKEEDQMIVTELNIVEETPLESPVQLTIEETIEHALENERIFTAFNYSYNMVRDTVSSNKSFNEHEDGILRSELLDQKGKLTGKAELRLDTIDLPKGDEATLWLNLVQSTINAFDELTADLLDIISHMWLVQEKDADGYINFHSDEVLKLRHENINDKPLVIRERDRFKIMKRVAALSSIWLSMRENSVKVVDRATIKDDEDYDFTTFHRMFDINSVKVAYDKKTGEPKGIYELKVKPAPILRSYFDATLQTFVPIDLKIIQYSYNNQRELKRLGRYLSYQWKVRTLSRTLNQAFKVKTLLDAIDFPSSYNGVAIRERLEHTLDELVNDKIIEEWYYKEPIEEERVGKRDWVRKYWSELSIMINPPKETIEINKQKFGNISDLIAKEEATELLLNDSISSEYMKLEETPKLHDNTPLSPESIGLLIEELKLSIRGAAAEIGISHSTLIRYVSNEAKRSNKSVLEKLEKWFKEYVKNL
ncbi:hypothetical protein [Solibacillus sp.]|uniref:hypothetical protein n=1 Tax=Solibacillus sp. TaxID=1909654 RepID=UPI0033157E2C